MNELPASPHLADLALAVLAAEAVGLWALRRFLGRGPGLAPLLWLLLAGAALLVALRIALAGGGGALVGLFLALAGVAHLLDLRRRRAGQR
jgi:hypothetical protein